MIVQKAIDADDIEIQNALEKADALVLRAAIYQLTGDEELAELPVTSTIFMGAFEQAILGPLEADIVKKKAFDYLKAKRDNNLPVPEVPSPEHLYKIMNLCSTGTVPRSYMGPGIEELALVPQPREVTWDFAIPADKLSSFKVLIIGAGMAGICAAIQLKNMGIAFQLVEKNAGVGGTWFENTYPDARVDVPTHHYSYSFEANYPWRHFFAEQAEIKEYLEYCAEKYQVLPDMQFDTEVVAARWDDENPGWVVEVHGADGATKTSRYNAIISAVGMLNRPKLPDLKGMKDFAGKIFHTSRWDHDADYAGKRVALIGTGASGLQLAGRVAKTAGSLVVYQRTPSWLSEIPGYTATVDPEITWLYENVPFYANWYRFRLYYGYSHDANTLWDKAADWDAEGGALNERTGAARAKCIEYLERKLGSKPELLKRCIPEYTPLARRMVVDNGWLDALMRDNVDLVSETIDTLTPKGVLTTDGVEREFDVIVLASGFYADRYLWPIQIEGRGGESIGQIWSKDGARAYLGITVPKLPNFFMLYGPNTNPKNGSPCMMSELQVRYSLQCIKKLVEEDLKVIEVDLHVHNDYNTRADEVLSQSIWMDPRAKSYYRNDQNRIVTNMPWLTDHYWAITRHPDFAQYHLE